MSHAARSRAGEARQVRKVAAVALVIAAVALVLAACGGEEPARGVSTSTLDATWVDRDGNGFLERGPGEPLIDRGPAAPLGRTLTTFGQLTDTQVRDEESPARVPFLDRLGAPLNSTFRPQEAFSPQVLDAAVRALRRERPQALLVTGDIVDSAQQNELDQALAVLGGGAVEPDSGGRGYAGVQAASNPDPFLFRPDLDAPRHPGALAAAQRPFRAAGAGVPWFPALGNHDILVQGEAPPSEEIERIATGAELVVGLEPDFEPPADVDTAAEAVQTLVTFGDVFGRREAVPPDPARRHVTPREAVERLAGAAGVEPAGERLDYSADIGDHVRLIVLDTVDREGGSRADVSPGQVEWLRDELVRAGDRWIVVASHNPLDETALAALDEAPRMVAAIAGNSHRNRIEPRGSYWRISTSSLADFPQQARMFRLCEAGGGVALETWMVDHDGRGLAGTARELAFLDAQGGRPLGFAGRPEDRNARLFVR